MLANLLRSGWIALSSEFDDERTSPRGQDLRITVRSDSTVSHITPSSRADYANQNLAGTEF